MMHETNKTRHSRYEKSAPIVISEIEKARASKYRSEWDNSSVLAPVVLTSVLLLVSALTLVSVTWVLWATLRPGTLQVVFSVSNGMLLSLPVLISLWIVLGGQKWIIRIPLATFFLLALSGIFVATLGILSKSADDSLVWWIGAITLAVSAAIQIPAWIVRARYGVSVSRQSNGRTGWDSVTSKQFTIKQLLITTTILALVVPLLQWFATFKMFSDNTGGPPVAEICGFCGIFIVVLVFLTLLSVLVVFVPKLRVASLCILLVGLFAVPIVVVPSINFVFGLKFSFTDSYFMDTAIHINVFAFMLSNAVTVIAVLAMYYALGFRLSTRQGR